MRASRMVATGGLCCFVDSDIDKNGGNLRVCSQSANYMRPLVVLQELPFPTVMGLCLLNITQKDLACAVLSTHRSNSARFKKMRPSGALRQMRPSSQIPPLTLWRTAFSL